MMSSQNTTQHSQKEQETEKVYTQTLSVTNDFMQTLLSAYNMVRSGHSNKESGPRE